MQLLVKKYGLVFCLVCMPCLWVLAQQKIKSPVIHDTTELNIVPQRTEDTVSVPTPFVIRDIYITGNKKTKAYVIERELPFKKGDEVALNQLVSHFEEARQLLMNTSLFHDVIVALKSFEGYNVDVLVDVTERWYIFPIPYFNLVDRNINQWWVEQKRSLDRVNYGLKFNYLNVTGRKDRIKLWLVNGYTRQIEIGYEQPYADNSLKHGYNIGFSYSTNREVNYATVNDRQAFYKDDRFIKKTTRFNLDYVYRPAIKTRHTFQFIYTDEKVEDTIAKLNPDYFGGGRSRVRIPELAYSIDYQSVDYLPYPQEGLLGKATISKQGFSDKYNVWQLSAHGSYNTRLSRKSSFSVEFIGSLRLPFDQPFYARELLGYGERVMRGMEYYVIDGVAGFVTRSTLRRKLFEFSINNPLKSNLEKVPFRFFIKTYADFGYAYTRDNGNDRGNRMNNRLLKSAGFGIDVLTLYDFVISFEYSFNQFGQNGLFLHNRGGF
ncbi:MAG TPA: POTRA domain-containing protein [Parasegetibacter sp.]